MGIHTHANFILFDTGAHNLAAMQADPADYPRLTFKAHSRLPTDRAALPPGLAMPGDPPLDNPYGPMDGGAKGPGWGVVVLHQGGRNTAKVSRADAVCELGRVAAAGAAEEVMGTRGCTGWRCGGG